MHPEVLKEVLAGVEQYQLDPLGWANYAYNWGSGELANESVREWQREVLQHIGSKLQNPATRHHPIRIARASGHGIGKSALIGIIINWALSTCDDCRVVVTANTENQLTTKTSPEAAKWSRMSITADWFEAKTTSIKSTEAGHSETWRCDLVPWSANNTEAFAGLHNKGRRIVAIFDEASAIDDKIWEVAEGALTDDNTEIIWVVFGNPTRNTGRFRECFRKYAHLWNHKQIDSRTVEGTNRAYLDELVATYGEDSDIVKVRVRGMFPSASAKQFISTADVDAAYGRHLRPEQYDFAPIIITCDPAWEGDDELVIAKRQGLYFEVLRTIPKNDNDVQIASILSHLEDEHKADAVFIDAGYGTGIKSAGDTMGREWQLVWFAGEAVDKGYLNKRAEMWGHMKEWIKHGGAIPKDQRLYDDLIGPETVARLDGKVQLEGKQDMKKRGLPSPNRADALAISFAYPVEKKRVALFPGHHDRPRLLEHDPYASFAGHDPYSRM